MRLDFFAGYPITPQTEMLEYISRRLPQEGKVFVQAESEIASSNMIMGAAIGGARAMTATSGPGLALMAEVFSNLGIGRLADRDRRRAARVQHHLPLPERL